MRQRIDFFAQKKKNSIQYLRWVDIFNLILFFCKIRELCSNTNSWLFVVWNSKQINNIESKKKKNKECKSLTLKCTSYTPHGEDVQNFVIFFSSLVNTIFLLFFINYSIEKINNNFCANLEFININILFFYIIIMFIITFHWEYLPFVGRGGKIEKKYHSEIGKLKWYFVKVQQKVRGVQGVHF